MEDDGLWKWLVGTLFSGLGTTVLSNLKTRRKQDENTLNIVTDNEVVATKPEDNHLDYKTRLGARHKTIRSELLGLSERQMADFYGFETVSELLELEVGTIEFSKTMLIRLCDFFFLKEDIFDLDVPIRYPFETFSLHHEEVERLLEDGFNPVIACSPNDRKTDLYCSIMMCKQQNGLYRVKLANRNGRFKSGHGGKMNVEQLIHAMIKTGKSDTQAKIVKVNSEQWSKIETRKFYQNIESQDLDWDCQDIFDKWYLHYDKKFGNKLRSHRMKKYQ